MRDSMDRETPAVLASAPAERSAARRSARICWPTLAEVALRFGEDFVLASGARRTTGLRAVGNGDAGCLLLMVRAPS